MEGGRGNWFAWWMERLLSSFGRSDLRGAVGEARAANSFGDTYTIKTLIKTSLKYVK